MSNFQFPLNDQKWDKDDFTSGVEVSYIRHLGKFVNLAVPLKLAKAELPLDDKGTVRNGELIASLDALLHLKFLNPDFFIYPYLLGGVGVMTETKNNWNVNAEFPVGLGLNFRLATHTYLSLETQYRIDLSDNRNQLQHALGLWLVLGEGAEEKKPEISDMDKDGIPDQEDQCPNEPGTAALFGCPDRDGDGVADKLDDCPDKPGKTEWKGCPDSDGDGLADNQDNCPDEAGPVDNKGCPDNDRDKDGVTNDKDRCPDTAGSVRTEGCPDKDNDGLADDKDKCPDLEGRVDLMGCPDKDNDGIIDPEDKCPNSPGPASNNGCPELKEETKKKLEYAVKAVQFETGKATLLPSSYKVLDEIVEILKEYPDHKMRINGHTDSIGDNMSNQKLSEARAKACYDYFVSKGIASARMSHQGYGESKPIADNRFAPGREKNRRVEFDVYHD
jgi:outer membrane protein OmpA-like peptidoglycan-associated protein